MTIRKGQDQFSHEKLPECHCIYATMRPPSRSNRPNNDRCRPVHRVRVPQTGGSTRASNAGAGPRCLHALAQDVALALADL